MWLPIAVAVLFLIVILLSWLAFQGVMKRPKSKDLSDEEVPLTSELFGYAAVLRPALNWFASRKWESATVTAADGAVLRGLWLPCKNAGGSILLLHDYGGAPRDLAPVARWAEKRKLSILAVFERAHGESGGEYTSLGLLEADDAVLWLHKMQELNGEDIPIVLYGSGMGGAAVMQLADRELPDCVVAGVTEGGYPSVKEMIRHVMKHEFHMRVFPMLQFMGLFGQLIWHRTAGKLDAKESLKSAKLPLLFAHGEADRKIPPEMSKDAHDACASAKKLVSCENAGHGACPLAEPELYFGELDAFLLPLLKKNGGKS